MSQEPAAPEPQDVRALLGEALDGYLEPNVIRTLIDEVLKTTKTARGWCSECKRAVNVQVPDAKAVTSAISELLTQARGRPGQAAEGTEGPKIHFTRTVIYRTPESETANDLNGSTMG